MSKQTDLVEIAQDGIVVPDASVSEAKLQVSNAPTDGYMLTAQSGNTGGLTWAEAPSSSTTAGAVGTYAFANTNDNNVLEAGDTTSGSTLKWANIAPLSSSSPAMAGTWRVMGRALATYSASAATTLFVRIL